MEQPLRINTYLTWVYQLIAYNKIIPHIFGQISRHILLNSSEFNLCGIVVVFFKTHVYIVAYEIMGPKLTDFHSSIKRCIESIGSLHSKSVSSALLTTGSSFRSLIHGYIIKQNSLEYVINSRSQLYVLLFLKLYISACKYLVR